MTRNGVNDDVESIANQMLNWGERANWHDEERALRLLQRLQWGPDKFIDKELSARENWEQFKAEYNLVLESEHQRNVRDYDEMDSRRKDQRIEERADDPIDIGNLDLPSYVGGYDIINCFDEPWSGTLQRVASSRPEPKDKEPPGDSPYSDWLVTKNLALSTKLRQAIESIASEEDKEEPETLRRLLRKGVPEVLRIITHGILSERDAELAAYRTGAKRAATFVAGDSQGYTELEETVQFQIPFKRPSRDSYRVVWWQQDAFDWIGEQVGVSENDAFRWSLVRGALAWHERFGLPEPLAQDLERIGVICESRAREQATAFSRAFIVTMNEAYEQGYGTEVMQSSFSDSREIAWEYMENIGSKAREMTELNPEVIAEETSQHPLDVVDRIQGLIPGVRSVPQQILVDGRIEYFASP